MKLVTIDWVVVAVFISATVTLGMWFTRRAGSNVEEFFVAGRTLPWWLAGTSIAATWFASDAPLATASLVRQQGIFGNWLWWYETGGIMLLVFFYAKLWRRANIITDAEFIELRYSGRAASALRGFAAVYHGVLRNCVVMGWVMLAMVKFSRVLLGWEPEFTLLVCVSLALAYTIAAGLWGVVVTDIFQFTAGMIGSLILAGIVLVKLGGPAAMTETIRALPDYTAGTLDVLPNPRHLSSVEFASYLCLILVLWTRSGHDGYMAQRLFATRDERQSLLAALWFSFAGTILMTWPWVIVGLGSLVFFPLSTAAPELAADPELAYPMMIAELMPAGLRGLLVAAFLAAFMSTMDTHLCWGASYLVTDVYRRFLKPDSSERHLVVASRVAVLVLVVLAALTAWQMDSIERAWVYIIEITAGLAVVLLLRWYWWRINAWAEIAALVSCFAIANGGVWVRLLTNGGLLSTALAQPILTFYGDEFTMIRAVFILVSCGAISILVALRTRPTADRTLDNYYRRVHPGGWWRPVAERNQSVRADTRVRKGWLGWFFGVLFIYASLLAAGYFTTGRAIGGLLFLVVAAGAGIGTLASIRGQSRQQS
jgi:SSS family solute:Na+ symporter